MDIGSGHGYPSSALSNFAPHSFTFDGVECASMEGLLMAFKYSQIHQQIASCGYVGLMAKKRARGRNKHWQRVQKLWWNGVEFDRHGPEYQALLDRAYDALAANDGFRRALLASGDAVLTHSIGRRDPHDTVLTRREFCSRLTKLRVRLREEASC
jgi:predicted NAD-dependent protein-ADP-ribosyltransferase YbiA (DUF1768 family)